MLFCKVSFVYVCLYVFYAAIYFRVWLCGCGYVGVVVRMSEFFLDPPLAALNRKLLLLQNLRVLLFCCQYLRRKAIQQGKCAKRKWIRTLFKERSQKDLYDVLVKDLLLFDNEYFLNHFGFNRRNSKSSFRGLHRSLQSHRKFVMSPHLAIAFASPCGT